MNDKINYPVAEFKSGKFSSAVFEATKQSRDGRDYTQKSIRLQKSYLDPGTGQWVNQSITIFAEEIGDLESVARNARDHCRLKTKLNENE